LFAKATGNSIKLTKLSDGNHKFGVVAVDPYGNASAKATKSVTVTDVGSIKSSLVEFSPNPVINFINLKNVEPNAIVKFYSISGQNVLTTTTGNGRIDVNRFENGVYIINIQSGKKVFISKMIKK
jgi:hypothetical protein